MLHYTYIFTDYKLKFWLHLAKRCGELIFCGVQKHMSEQPLFLSQILMQFRLRYFYLSIFVYVIFAETQT